MGCANLLGVGIDNVASAWRSVDWIVQIIL